MTTFERLVRPFETPRIGPAKSSPSSRARGSGAARFRVGGTPSAGAQLVVTVISAALPGSPITVSYTLDGSDTLATAALAIVGAINGNAALAAAGFVAAIVPTQPLSFTVTQPATLNPQARFSAAATGNLTLDLDTDDIVIQVGRRGRLTVWNTSYSTETTVYTVKYPKEVPQSEVPPEMRIGIAQAAARFRNS
jgi:hypothetical protein